MSSWQSYNNQSQEMVDKFTRLAIITSKEVENAFRCVSRAAFVSKGMLAEAFVDAPIRGVPHIHMSAPHMYAAILEDLELEPGMSFLNIGSGTGYFSCLAGYIIKHHGINHGIELHEDLLEFSKERINDFLSNGPVDAKEICPPVLLTGNCFQLDPGQLKYDRLYCGGACSQSTITFFLEFLKVGGFLIAPVGTKLIKLERVSHKEGVKTVISDVCFAYLTRMEPRDVTKLRHGLLPLIQFPIKLKKTKIKKTIFLKPNFLVSNSPARKKLSRLRAIQHILDSLEEDSHIPPALCYVPQRDQINAYKQYKKVIDCQTPAMIPTENGSTNRTNVSAANSISPVHTIDESTQLLSSLSRTAPNPLMTIQEFLLAASPPTVFNELFGMSRTESSTRNENREEGTFLGPRLTSRDHNLDHTARLNESVLDILSQQATPSAREGIVANKMDVNEFEIGEKIANNIWEHICFDKLWESVVDYYYSVCSTTNERRKKCFELKGVEIVNPNAAEKLAKMFKLKTRKVKSNKKHDTLNTNVNNINIFPEVLGGCQLSIPADEKMCKNEIEKSIISMEASICEDVKKCVDGLIDKICATEENCDNSLHTLSGSTDNMYSSSTSLEDTTFDDSSQSSPLKSSCENKSSRYVDIQTDDETSKHLSHVGSKDWTIDHDVQLISFLVSYDKEKENLSLRDCVPRVINVDIFEKGKLLKFPLLSSFQPTTLAYRSIALLRVAKILDNVLDALVGPTLERNQFHNPFVERYPLPSFTAASFEVSDSQLNVLEAQSYKKAASLKEDEDDEIVYLKAKTSQDEELLKEVNSMICYEMSNVKDQQLILTRKLELIDNIDEQYKEQIKLLNQQVDLIEEQQRLLFEVNISCNEHISNQLSHSQQIVAERKQQRQSLLAKRDKISTDRSFQLAERKELLSMLEQLLSLETRLKNELQMLGKKGMGYLRGHGSELSHFSSFVRRAENILQRLKATNSNMNNIMNNKNPSDTKKSGDNKNKTFSRYQPETILPRCRFLLPLSKKRYAYIKEMLRTTERPSPRHMPVINVDRRTPLSERHAHDIDDTVFMQVYRGLKKKDLHYRWNKKSYEQWWEVKFIGEGIIDQGGGFRDSLTEMSDELCPADSSMKDCLHLFIKTPNQKTKIGEYLDCYTLNPQCKDFHLYHWLGQLMGACFRTDETLPLSLSPLIWKMLVGEQVYWKKDFIQIDEVAVRNIDGLENLDPDAYMGLNVEQTYSTVLSDSSQVELIEGGSNIVVKCDARAKYSLLVRKARLMECCEQVKALRNGLLLVIPEAVLSCLTWRNLERGICGDNLISVADLKANCRYGDNLQSSSQCVLHMWSALASFTDEERSRFIRFVTGRKRLPSAFVVSRSSVDKDSLPSATTCGSNLFLPEYSSSQIAKEKLRYAIYNCVSIDTDTSPW